MNAKILSSKFIIFCFNLSIPHLTFPHQAKKALHDWKKSFNRIEPERSFSELAFGQEELGKGSRQKNKPRARGPKPSKKEKTEISSLAATEGEGEGTVKLDVTNPVEEPISQYNKDLGVENFEEKTE